MAGFAHHGPLKPVDIPQAKWNHHPLLAWAELGPSGVVWEFGESAPSMMRAQNAEVARITFHEDSLTGDFVAHVPPRLNHDWFVLEDADEEAPAPILGRARDITRWYEREDDWQQRTGLLCADTVDDVRRYFEWLNGIWVQVPLFRWIIVRDTGELTEVAAKSIAAAYGSAVAQPRSVRAPSDPRLSGLDALEQAGRAEAIASIAHRGQTDKIGERYINHSARVAGTFDALDRPIEHAAGWLHAVIEHAEVSTQDLLDAGIRPEIVEIVALLTWTTDASEDEFLERIRYNDIARAVKAADLADNAFSWRTRLLDDETRRRLAEKNARARKYIGD